LDYIAVTIGPNKLKFGKVSCPVSWLESMP